jgi:aryl-alcohol dehydrogenase-like predicted oxidoreductase
MPKPTSKLSATLPPLVFGSATFNFQFNPDPFAMPTTHLVHRALTLGVRAFDTSPYYGPAEDLLGAALDTEFVQSSFPRSSYYLLTKVGRLASDEFDYSPSWVQHSVRRSLQRLRTTYLDVVYCHDVEFVSTTEVLEAIAELRRIRDEDHTIKYIGISGYPVHVLCDLAELVLRETGEPLDAVMSYANFTLQNTRLLTEGVPRLIAAGVDVVPNASPLAMGLLREEGVPMGAMGNWHPAPDALRSAIQLSSQCVSKEGERLEVVAVRFALESWLREGARVGGFGDPLGSIGANSSTGSPRGEKLGVSVMGVSNLEELEETMRVWSSGLDGLADDLDPEPGFMTPSEALSDHDWSLHRRQRIRTLAKDMRNLMGEYADFTWQSPGKDFVNRRRVMGFSETAEELSIDTETSAVMMTPPPEAANLGDGDDIPVMRVSDDERGTER